MKLAFEKCVTGHYSYADVAQILNEVGYCPRDRGDRTLRLFSKDMVNAMPTNRFYGGEVAYRGKHYARLSESGEAGRRPRHGRGRSDSREEEANRP
jgi:hypothetical protein